MSDWPLPNDLSMAGLNQRWRDEEDRMAPYEPNLDIDQAIEEVKRLCDDYQAEYRPVSLRSALVTLGYDSEEIDIVITDVWHRGFTYCLDHTKMATGYFDPGHNRKNEYPAPEVCYWGPDQLKSRLQALSTRKAV